MRRGSSSVPLAPCRGLGSTTLVATRQLPGRAAGRRPPPDRVRGGPGERGAARGHPWRAVRARREWCARGHRLPPTGRHGHDDGRPRSSARDAPSTTTPRAAGHAWSCPRCSARCGTRPVGSSSSAGATAARGSCPAARSTSGSPRSRPPSGRPGRSPGCRWWSPGWWGVHRPGPRRALARGTVRQQFVVVFHARPVAGAPYGDAARDQRGRLGRRRRPPRARHPGTDRPVDRPRPLRRAGWPPLVDVPWRSERRYAGPVLHRAAPGHGHLHRADDAASRSAPTATSPTRIWIVTRTRASSRHRGDVPEPDRREDGDGEVQAVGAVQRLGERARLLLRRSCSRSTAKTTQQHRQPEAERTDRPQPRLVRPHDPAQLERHDNAEEQQRRQEQPPGERRPAGRSSGAW